MGTYYVSHYGLSGVVIPLYSSNSYRHVTYTVSQPELMDYEL